MQNKASPFVCLCILGLSKSFLTFMAYDLSYLSTFEICCYFWIIFTPFISTVRLTSLFPKSQQSLSHCMMPWKLVLKYTLASFFLVILGEMGNPAFINISWLEAYVWCHVKYIILFHFTKSQAGQFSSMFYEDHPSFLKPSVKCEFNPPTDRRTVSYSLTLLPLLSPFANLPSTICPQSAILALMNFNNHSVSSDYGGYALEQRDLRLICLYKSRWKVEEIMWGIQAKKIW